MRNAYKTKVENYPDFDKTEVKFLKYFNPHAFMGSVIFIQSYRGANAIKWRLDSLTSKFVLIVLLLICSLNNC